MTHAHAPPSAAGTAARFAFHTAVVAYMLHSYLSIASVIGKAIEAEYGGDLQFLTVCGMITATVAMGLSAVHDLMPFPALHGAKRLFALAAMPVEITISAIYWPLIILAPQLMLPPDLAAAPDADITAASADAPLVFLPLWMDLGLHAVPAVSLIIDFFFLERKYRPPMSTWVAFAVAATFSTAYVVWVEHCASINGHFPYPFLTIMSFEDRTKIYAASALFALLVFRGLNALHK
ncbi:hypothetical protein CC85DRAFT_265427 [Cutaneotrichosporon oleaginosum]|uniref:FAR-17a/AIG1-like protein n=1 Tax=Cutaneotrichosporon oleaginosum TaxID=879819 RepID=A0A0J0XEB2_9TREE|nr:uncharacterized protein CC85DRAFT_265427 [Cutaneotrichosporon oleaginosum]KLT39411.1 hypothetical protein CC85DRAFT_265427 [Cutaneotrichosporon oleaginosum]TXT15386.1 hypothetical protein COLE_01579 [Cutaneotrichosporon oleaginosum]